MKNSVRNRKEVITVKRNYYKITTLLLLIALVVTLAVSTTNMASAGGRCHGISAQNVCVNIDGRQMSLQEAFGMIEENMNGVNCRIDYLSTEAGGFFGSSIGELRGAFEYLSYLFPADALHWTPFPTPPT